MLWAAPTQAPARIDPDALTSSAYAWAILNTATALTSRLACSFKLSAAADDSSTSAASETSA